MGEDKKIESGGENNEHNKSSEKVEKNGREETGEKSAASHHSPYYFEASHSSNSSRPLVYLLTLIIIVLVGIVLYLLSERNSNRFFLIEKNGNLIVEKGYFFPIGSSEIKPADKAEEETYRPIALPPEARPFEKEAFSNRVNLHTALGNMLLSWSKKRLFAKDETEFKKGWQYLKRAELLSGLPQATMDDLSKLKGGYVYNDGVRLISSLDEKIKNALERFKEARRHKASEYNKNAEEWIARAEEILAILEGKRDVAKKESPEKAPPLEAPVTIEEETEAKNPPASDKKNQEPPAKAKERKAMEF
ncbi:MAG: hypothetical protein Kow0090_01930 [Myxococcota bacterium]